MKKIALIITNFDRLISKHGIKGGGSHVLKNLMLNWAENPDVTLDIYCTYTSTYEYQGINKITKIPLSQYENIENFVEALKKQTVNQNYNNILFGEVIAPYGSVLLQAHSFIYRYDLYGGFLSKFFKKTKKTKIISQKERFSNENNIYIAMSEKIKDDYSTNFDIPKERIFVVYPGTEVPEKIEKTSGRSIKFGIVGSSNPNKGSYRFLKALSLVKKKHKNIEAVMICNNYKRLYWLRFLIWLYNVKSNINILDFQSDMSNFYQKVDCIVMPSRHEAFGLVALEGASYQSIPLVSSNTGFAEIITEGENGFTFDINKRGIKNLAQQMENIVDLYYKNPELFNQISKNAHELSKKYTWKGFSEKILNLL